MKKSKLKSNLLKAMVTLVCLAAAGGYIYMSQFKLVADHYTLKSEKIPQAFKGYKIVHLSDIHGEPYGEGQKVLIDKILAQKPDLIVVSGDTLDTHYNQWDNSLIVLETLAKTTPVYFSTGNHEYWTRYRKETTRALEKTGAVYLKNKTVPVKRNGETIYLSGIDDPWYFINEEGGFKATLSKIRPENPNAFSMLISHRPERQKEYVMAGFDLTFSGHAHGGQVRLPFTQGLIAPNQGIFPSLTAGLHTFEDKHLLVSRGLGNPSKMPRFFNPPQIVVLTLDPQ